MPYVKTIVSLSRLEVKEWNQIFLIGVLERIQILNFNQLLNSTFINE